MIVINTNTIQLLFALLRSAIRGDQLQGEEREHLSEDVLQELYVMSRRHDVAHLLAHGLDANGLLKGVNGKLGNEIIMAMYRYTQLDFEYSRVCHALENAHIAFIPLKGAVLRQWYPEPWMRTSCDIDILVHREHLEEAVSCLIEALEYTEHERATHDVALFSQNGMHIEIHFDLVEEGRAGASAEVLRDVWKNVSLKTEKAYWYEMTDEFFYFYHIAHMAKHFEVGGCGIRPFIDLWILDNKVEGADKDKRNKLLKEGGLLKFAEVAQALSNFWLEGTAPSEVALKLQDFIMIGGVYGSPQNKVALQQSKKGGRLKYIFSRLFVPYDKLKRYYPILEKHRWLMPLMQIRRWGMIFRPNVAKMAKYELSANMNTEKAIANEMNEFLNDVGL